MKSVAERFAPVATALAEEAFRKMHEGPIVDVGPSKTKSVLRNAFLAAMLETRAQTVEEIAEIIERADPPQDAATAPAIFAKVLRDVFAEPARGSL